MYLRPRCSSCSLYRESVFLFSLSNRISYLDAEMVTTREMETARNSKERGK